MTFRIFPAEEADLSAMASLAARVFSDAWSFDAFLSSFRSPATRMTVAKDEAGVLLGYLVASTVPPESEIADLATAPEYRRMGVGRALLEEFFREAGDGVCYLEVRAANAPAAALYEAFGFSVCGRRKNYYKQPTEDAILMRRGGKDET